MDETVVITLDYEEEKSNNEANVLQMLLEEPDNLLNTSIGSSFQEQYKKKVYYQVCYYCHCYNE